ncbi:MAG: HsdR family type I site-specific deoxyribonuclease, partial [Raoultibacter sp.]
MSQYEYAVVSMNEDFYEQVVIEHLRNSMGYEYLYGPDVPRTTDEYRDVFLPEILPISLRRINPSLPRAAIDEAVLKISSIDGGTLEQRNESFHEYLQSGVEVRFFDGTEERNEIVYLIDYRNPEANTFHVVNQWTYVEYSEKRPDVLVFVNGMPLVMFELKSPSREETDSSDAYLQLRNYMKHIPALFVPNAFCVMSDMADTRVGTITATEDRFIEWKSVDGDYANTVHANYETMLQGMFAKDRLIDIIKNFLCFNDSSDKVVKILAGYHQYFAVNKALQKSITAVEGDGKIGVFWHTQGSGKSLSMVFLAHLLQEKLLSPTLVVVTDRNDLDDQLYSQFCRCKQFLRQTPEKAASRKNLKKLLGGREANGIIFTTMQKFMDGDDPLCDRSNVIVMVDEAH